MDQQQEDIATLKTELAELQREHRILQDHVEVLRSHIAEGKPRPFPASLTGGTA